MTPLERVLGSNVHAPDTSGPHRGSVPDLVPRAETYTAHHILDDVGDLPRNRAAHLRDRRRSQCGQDAGRRHVSIGRQ